MSRQGCIHRRATLSFAHAPALEGRETEGRISRMGFMLSNFPSTCRGGGDSGHGTSTVFCALVPSQFEAVCSRPPGHILCTSRLSTTKWQGFPGRYCCVPFFLLWRTETLHCLLQLLNKERCPAHHLFLCASRPRSNLPTTYLQHKPVSFYQPT